MFRDIERPSVRVGGRHPLILPVSIIAHVVVITMAVFASLMAPDVLPSPAQTLIAFVSGDVVLPPEPVRPPERPSAPPPRDAPVADTPIAAVPLEAPEGIGAESLVPRAPVPVASVDGVGYVGPEGLGSVVAPPPPPIPPPAPPAPVRIGGAISPPVKVRDVRPVYPSLARASRVEGVVIVELTIGTSGEVLDARLLRSVPLLDAAALDAVGQWTFTPTLLNGSPVPVIMTVTVNFSLQ